MGIDPVLTCLKGKSGKYGYNSTKSNNFVQAIIGILYGSEDQIPPSDCQKKRCMFFTLVVFNIFYKQFVVSYSF